jgi:Na+-translocating ferredoxin:NAD+ oxidoreductase RnfG subunit
MKKTILIAGVIAIFSTVSSAQTQSDTIQQLQRQIVNLEILNSRLSKQVIAANSNIKKLEDTLCATVDSVEVLKNDLALTSRTLIALADKLELQIRQLNDKSDSDFSVLSKRLNNNTIYWILAILLIALFPALLFGWLRKRLSGVKTELSEQIEKSSEAVREDILKLDNKVFWSLDIQKKSERAAQNEKEDIDHSLALKVADEILRIQRYLSSMDPETNGLKQLGSAVDRIQDNFRENGYEMVELLNKPYDQGMKMSAKFKPDTTLKPGDQIITRIIKPQVNYNSLIIQEAHVEVSVGQN